MTEIRFYHLTRRPLDQALPDILMKALQRGHKIVVRTSDEKETEFLNERLWTFHPNKFIPHGSAKDGDAELQPVWLTHGGDNPNAADLLVMTGGADDAGYDAYNLCCLMFDGRDETYTQTARSKWKTYKEAGHDITYWQQTEMGWEQKG